MRVHVLASAGLSVGSVQRMAERLLDECMKMDEAPDLPLSPTFGAPI